MEREPNPMQVMCRSGCGFYGNPETDGFCSVCYKDSLGEQQQPLVSSTPDSVPSPQPTPTFTAAIAITNAAQPTVQGLQQQHTEIKERLTDEAAANKSNSEVAANAGPSSSTAAATSTQTAEENKDAKEKKNRCAECRKKVGLTGFQCRCGGLYCPFHRYSDKHNCTFDYRELGAQEIRRNNPVVIGEKIQKI